MSEKENGRNGKHQAIEQDGIAKGAFIDGSPFPEMGIERRTGQGEFRVTQQRDVTPAAVLRSLDRRNHGHDSNSGPDEGQWNEWGSGRRQPSRTGLFSLMMRSPHSLSGRAAADRRRPPQPGISDYLRMLLGIAKLSRRSGLDRAGHAEAPGVAYAGFTLI